jgi:hydroxyacylglutathione hydrolase
MWTNNDINLNDGIKMMTFKADNIFFMNYSYILYDDESKESVIIDPAWDLKKYYNFIDDKKLKLKAILLTHGHYDHMNLVKDITKLHDINVYININEIQYENFKCINMVSVEHLDKISIGKNNIICLHTPGHTEGSQCFLTSKYLFSGDTVFIEGVGICSDERMASKMYESIKFIKNYLFPQVLIFPAHKYLDEPGQTLNFLINNNIYFLIDKKEEFIKYRLRKKQYNIFSFN